MGFLIPDTWIEILLFTATILVVLVHYFYNSYNYWERKGVPTIPPKFPLGNSNSLFPKGFVVGPLSKHFYDEFRKRGHKFGGVYLVTTPNFVLVDPDYIKDVLVKDFQHFVDRGMYYNKKDDPLSAHLFAIDGIDWKPLRTKLTPTFTSGKMKTMFHSIIQCCDHMVEEIDGNLGKDMDTREMMGCLTIDVIGSCAFGIECNSFKHPNAEFRSMGRRIFEYRFFKAFRAFFLMNLPKLSLRLGLRYSTEDVRSFFTTIVAETVRTRQENNTRRNDFLQILIDMNDTCNFSLEEITAQVYVFFIAGFDTSSSAMTFALYELAKNPEAQRKLRAEVRQVVDKHDGQITYENLKEMKYLQQVFDETVRMYPPLTTLHRRCTKDYTLRDTDVVIEEGTHVIISALGLHMDPKYYPEPDKFDPERFNEKNKKERHPFVHLPFGDGPRNCIGLRFGLMQSKIGIATVIKHFQLSVSPATKPIEFNPYMFLLRSVNPIYLKAERV